MCCLVLRHSDPSFMATAYYHSHILRHHSTQYRVARLKIRVKYTQCAARMPELVDALHSKCNIERCVGSSPTSGTKVAEHVPQVSCGTLLVKALSLRCDVLYLAQIFATQPMNDTPVCMAR